MSYNHMMSGGQRPHYDQQMPTYPPHQPQFQPPPFPPATSPTSIALFHIPKDATNSLYVDGVPNNASEREVSRTP
jgi:hypothetical protein